MTTHRPLDEADILLIQRVKSTPSLYDPRNGDFRLSQRKEQDWEKVASSLNINILDARRRWTCLRDRYSRELKQIRLHPNRNDYGRNDFFRQMDFLREFVRKRRERSRRDDSILHSHNNSWSKGKLSVSKTDNSTHSEGEVDEETEETQIYEDSVQNYDSKLAVHASTTSAEAYSMIVEETHEPYEHYHVQPGTPGSSSDTKQISLTPVLLQQQNGSKPSGAISSGALTPQLQTGMQQQHQPPQLQQQQSQVSFDNGASETEDDYFCKSVAAYLRQLSRRHKIKAKVEIYQILEKYIELEECASASTTQKG